MWELLGWAVICVAVGLAIGLLLAQWRRPDARRYAAVPLAGTAVAAGTYTLYWLDLYAPMAVKVLFTTSLQIVGSLGGAGITYWLAYILWSESRGY